MAAYTTIDDPGAYFNTIVYAADDNSPRTLTGVGFQPDFCWTKLMAGGHSHNLYDSVRGAGADKELESATNKAEGVPAASEYGYLSAFTSDGFTITAGTDGTDGLAFLNKSSYNTGYGRTKPYGSWNWKESATAGFDIVAYTGDGSSGRTVAHSLSAVPHFMIIKNRGRAESWMVYHQRNTAAPETDYLALDTTAATGDSVSVWNDTVPDSSNLTLGNDAATNYSSDTYIGYFFSEKQGYSKFGTYEGNGNADGAFVYTGFRPAFVMTKSIDSTSQWQMFDNKREGYNPDNNPIEADISDGEGTDDMIDLLSNGFKCRIATDPNVAETFVYAAFAEAPFVNSEGVPCNAR